MCCCSMAQLLKNHKAKWEVVKGRKLTPVLAVGSNAAPAQLERKFPLEMFPDGVVIPVLRCVLPDFDVVYAPLISSYGSCTGECPSCLPPHPPHPPVPRMAGLTSFTAALTSFTAAPVPEWCAQPLQPVANSELDLKQMLICF